MKSDIVIVIIIVLLMIVPHIYSQEVLRHTPNFPYNKGISIDELINDTDILSILRKLANRSIGYSEAIEALEEVGALDRETAHRLATIYNATDSEILNIVRDEQLNELFEGFKEGSLSVDELKGILRYIDYMYGLGLLDTVDYIAILNMISNLYSKKGMEIPIDLSSKIYSALTKLLTNSTLVIETPQSIVNISRTGIETPSPSWYIPQVSLLPSIDISIPHSTIFMIAIAIISIVSAIVFRDRIVMLLNRLYRAIDSRVYRARSRGLEVDKLDPVVLYWLAVRIMERLSKIKRNCYTTHREYLSIASGVEDRVIYNTFVRLTQLYELYRFGFRRDHSIVDEAIKLYNSIVKRYGEY